MNKETKSIVTAVLDSLHENYETVHMDDIEYILLLKVIMQGVERGISHNEESEMEIIKKEFYIYSRKLYLKTWLSNGDEGEDIEQAKQEGMQWFDYSYTNEEYPR